MGGAEVRDGDVGDGRVGGGCLVRSWPCVSGVIASSLHYLDNTQDIVR